MADAPDLSIVIVNWKSVDYLGKCLASIYANSKDISLEVLVVDNASYDGCAEMIRREFPAARFIQSQDNLGFARANNLASEHSTGRVLLFLNPDTEVVGPALGRMVAWLESLPDAGVLGPKLLNSDLSIQMSCVQSFPSILNQVLDSEYLRAMFPKWTLWGNRALFEDHRDPVPVEGVSGACLMIRRRVFETVGRFNPEYFMYAEDVDLCFKVRHAGWKNYYVGEAVVVHYGGQSSSLRRESHFASVAMRESWRKFFSLHYGRNRAFIYRATTALAALFRIGLLAGLLLVTAGRLRRDLLLGALGKWTRIFRWTIGLESWVSTLRPR